MTIISTGQVFFGLGTTSLESTLPFKYCSIDGTPVNVGQAAGHLNHPLTYKSFKDNNIFAVILI
jgi:hypothetical protein